MSAESELRALLVANAALVALVPAARIKIDAAEQGAPRPYIVFNKPANALSYGLDGSKHAEQVTIEIQCVGTSRANALAVSTAVVAALEQAGEPPSSCAAGYDQDNDLEVEVVTVDWFLV